MSIYGDLSKAQRSMLAALFSGIQQERVVPGRPAEKGRTPIGRKSRSSAAAVKRAVSIDTALVVDGKSRQTAKNLKAIGLVDVGYRDERWTYGACRVWLTEAGVQLMRSLDYRHARTRS